MRDNFNLTGWVRNKTLLKENIEESQSFDWKPLPQNGNSKRGNFPVTINNDTAIVYDETNSRPIARFTKDDLKGIQDGGYVGTTLGGYQLNNSDELKQWAMGGDEEMNEEVDGFEDSENLPEDVKELLDMWSDRLSNGKGGYDAVGEMLSDFENLGWTFDFGLDGEPYGLRPMSGDQNEINEDQETWKTMRDQGFQSGYEAGYDDGKKGRPNDFTKRIAK